jgi:hypothetical protein
MKRISTIMLAAVTSIGALASLTGAASAQGYYAHPYGYGAPAYHRAPAVMPYGGPVYVQPRGYHGGWQAPQYQPRPQFVPQRPAFDPYPMIARGAGVAATTTLQGYGVPAPIAGWAGGRITANGDSAWRERNPVEAGVKIGTGVSMHDIRQHGILGGKNSEARKILRLFGG